MCLNTYNKHGNYLNSCVVLIFESILENSSVVESIELYKNALIRQIVCTNKHMSHEICTDTKDIVELLNNKERVSSVCRVFGDNDDAFHFLAIDTEIRRFIVKNSLWVEGSKTRCDLAKARRVLAAIM